MPESSANKTAAPGRLPPASHFPESGWARWLPGLNVLFRYEAAWLRHDLVAGLVMTAMLVPVGIAYAEASGLPGINGLYATVLPLLAYAVFGPSRIIVLGPDSALAGVILAVVLPLSAGDRLVAVPLAAAMAVVSGLVCVGAGLARLGFITELLSKPIRYGYMNGIALSVLLSQIPKLLGFSVSAPGPVRQVVAILREVLRGRTNVVAFAIGGGTLLLIFLLKRWPRIPGILIAVVAATLVVALFDLASRAGIAVLGPLPQGLPSPQLPLISAQQVMPIVTGGLAIALVSFADTSVLSRSYASRLRTPVDPNQEMIGLGMANLAAGFFQGFPISASSSRTPVAEAAGARTQVTGIVGAVAIGSLLMFAPQLLQYLPQTALSAVVIASAIGLFEVSDLRRIYRIQRWEFWVSMTCFAGVAVFGVTVGIGIAVVISVIEFLWDGWRPYSAVLGEVAEVRGFHDITRYPEARRIPGLVLLRWDAPLFFANAELFNRRVRSAIESSPTPVRRLVIAAEPITSVDVTSADALCELDETLRAAGIELCFAEMKDPVKDKLKRFGLYARFGEESFFATVGEAVRVYLATPPGARPRLRHRT
jgi:high affinity sulfate transporter 1